MITLRVEIMTVQQVVEEEIPEPEGWADLTPIERREWCESAVFDMRADLVGMTYEYPDQDADSEILDRQPGEVD